jgi:hypothetical protein
MGNRLNTGFTFTPGSLEAKKHGNNRIVMTQPLMNEAENKIELIYQHLKTRCDDLVSEAN